MLIEAEKITSRDNQRLRYVRRVRDGREPERIFIEGIRLVDEALNSKLSLVEAFVSNGFSDNKRAENILHGLGKRNVSLTEVSSKVFESVVDTTNSQGIVLIAERPPSKFMNVDWQFKDRASLPVIIFLSGVNNPSNLGAILRTSEAAGSLGTMISPNSADPFSPKALRGSMGSAFRLPVWEGVSFDEALIWSAENGFEAVAVDTNAAISIYEFDWRSKTLLVFGSEAHGLNDGELEKIGKSVSIPMSDTVESLNLAVACGVTLFEARRQNV
ncbi:MAG: TrmH family RNA methyltransferase [Blastocatellia bacterium]